MKDALTITVLGIGVVFVGLMLTNLMIRSFSLLPKIAAIFMRSKSAEDDNVSGQETTAEIKPLKPVTPEILAAITAVLEVELRLRASLTEGKFTFK
jgi:Na+-transporting methylmalonyl-CoA/oxaloacetate decarboxylase gamma subunit